MTLSEPELFALAVRKMPSELKEMTAHIAKHSGKLGLKHQTALRLYGRALFSRSRGQKLANGLTGEQIAELKPALDIVGLSVDG